MSGSGYAFPARDQVTLERPAAGWDQPAWWRGRDPRRPETGIVGLSGLGAAPSADVRERARALLQNLAALADMAVSDLRAQDLESVEWAIGDATSWDDLAWSGWSEGRATKNEVAAALRQALAEVKRDAPGWFEGWTGTPPKQVAAFISAAEAISIRLKNRAASSDFDAPAIVEGDDARRLEAAEGDWQAKVEEDERLARGNECSPIRMLTGEVSPDEYLKHCAGLPWWARAAALGAAGLVAWKVYRWVVR